MTMHDVPASRFPSYDQAGQQITVEALQQQVQQLQEQLTVANLQLSEANGKLTEQARQVDDREQLLREANRQLDERNEQLARLEAAVHANAELGMVAELQEELRQAKVEAGQRQELLRQRAREFEAFRRQVREVAIRVAKEMSWCNDGLNEVLDELGLVNYTPRYAVNMVFRVQVIVESDDENDAERLALRYVDVEASNGMELDQLGRDVESVEEYDDGE